MLARILRAVLAWELLWAVGIAFTLHEAARWSWTASAVAGLLSPLAVHAVIVTGGILGGLRPGAGAPAPPRLSAMGFARAVALEFTASVRAFQMEMPLTPRRPLAGPDIASPSPLPVLLVHGYLCNRQVWRPMARFLAARGHAIEAVDLEPVFGSIDDYAAILDAGIARLRARTGASKVALLCHSMGGLAARAHLRAFGGDAVDRVITIGSPHRGTRNASRGLGENAAQMRPGSSWLRALEAGEDPAIRGLFTVILSRHDNVVVPQATQTLEGARTIVFDGIGHVRLLSDPAVCAAVADALSD